MSAGTRSKFENLARLASVGIAVDPPWAPGMAVLNEAHPKLDTFFAGSPWAATWRETLLKTPGAYRIEKHHLIGGVTGPGLALPIPLVMSMIDGKPR